MIRYPRSEAVTWAVEDRLREAVTAVLGRPVRRVGYRFGLRSGWPEGYARGQVDEAGQAVSLSFDGGTELIISWVTPGLVEGVDVEAGPAGSFPVPEGLQFETAAGDDSPWPGIYGSVLERVATAWQVAGQFAKETVWALRLTFEHHQPVVIALGIIESRSLSYHPQGLAVLFDESRRTCQDPMISRPSILWRPVGSATGGAPG